jgi:hypothetical protein
VNVLATGTSCAHEEIKCVFRGERQRIRNARRSGARRKIAAGATHKKASQNTPGFVAGVAGWLAYYVLQYPFVAKRASDVHWGSVTLV